MVDDLRLPWLEGGEKITRINAAELKMPVKRKCGSCSLPASSTARSSANCEMMHARTERVACACAGQLQLAPALHNEHNIHVITLAHETLPSLLAEHPPRANNCPLDFNEENLNTLAEIVFHNYLLKIIYFNRIILSLYSEYRFFLFPRFFFFAFFSTTSGSTFTAFTFYSLLISSLHFFLPAHIQIPCV